MKKTFFIATILFSVFCLLSCKSNVVKEMEVANVGNDATISGYVVEIGMTSLTVFTDDGETMIFNIHEADMSKAIDAKAGDLVTVFYLVSEDANELPTAVMVETEAPNQEEVNE
ncbi:MAG: hypothetical protein FWC34_01845 [Bacteroidetes bacterium]|nr:hypothetical protein [Bacteroidota bacterium]MCL2303607.1 hypothetical protein [Lentimicrobiaceae bacterium]